MLLSNILFVLYFNLSYIHDINILNVVLLNETLLKYMLSLLLCYNAEQHKMCFFILF